MKILMLGWELPPQNSGGLGVACYNLCKALSRRGIDLEFVLPYASQHNHDFMKVSAAHPMDVESISKVGGAYDSYLYRYTDGSEASHDMFEVQAMYERAVEQLADKTEFDIIHAHDWLTFRAAMRVKQKLNCPMILHVHSIEYDRSGGKRGNPMVHDIEESALMMADRVLAVSDYTRKLIHSEYKIPLDKIEVVHNSIDLDSIHPLDESNAYRYLSTLKSQGYKVITNIGRLTIQKGLPNLLRAAQIVVRNEPKTMFLIVGSGDQYEELIELSAELGIAKNVIFTGFQRGKAWRDAFAVSDLFVMPSVSEPFGLTPLEAASYGAPSLISKQSGVGELFNNCLKIDYWDINEMANQMIAAVRSDGMRQVMIENAQRELNSLSWNRSAEKVHDVYQRHSRHSMVAAK